MSDFIKNENPETFRVSRLVTVLYMEYTKDFFFEGESHDFWEIVYIDKGQMIVTAAEKRFLLRGGELAFHKPNEFHSVESDREVAPNLSVLSFECRSKYMKYFCGKIFKLSADEKKLLSSILSEGLSAYEKINPYPPIMGMKLKKDGAFGARQMTFNLLEQFLVALYRKENVISHGSRMLSPSADEAPEPVREIVRYMEENLGENLRIEDFAYRFGCGQSTVKKLFSTYMGRGLVDYFTELKMRKARELIRQKRMNVSQISEELGYSSVHHFSKQFRIRNGMSPTEYLHSVK